MSKFGHLHNVLRREGLISPAITLTPEPAATDGLKRVHLPEYVDRVTHLSLSEHEIRRIGLPGTEAVATRARLACAGTLMAARAALRHGFAASLAGGSHHAGPTGGSGYCVFNDAAFAARTVLDEGCVERILILDLDVHQGDGTARIFEGDERVFTVSLHGEKNFPARKARSDIDIGLADRTGDEAYLGKLESVLDRLGDETFDLAFYNAGVDPVAHDRLGRLSLSLEGLARREAVVLGRLAGAGIPLTVIMGGGYGNDPAEVAARHALVFAEAAGQGLYQVR